MGLPLVFFSRSRYFEIDASGLCVRAPFCSVVLGLKLAVRLQVFLGAGLMLVRCLQCRVELDAYGVLINCI